MKKQPQTSASSPSKLAAASRSNKRTAQELTADELQVVAGGDGASPQEGFTTPTPTAAPVKQKLSVIRASALSAAYNDDVAAPQDD